MLHLALVFGGPSYEYDISLDSAMFVYHKLRDSKYKIRLVGVDKSACWHVLEKVDDLNKANDNLGSCPVSCLKGCDVVFNLIHGNYGEDGTLQGFLDVLKIPYVGAAREGAHNTFDKEITKLILKNGGINVVKFCTLRDVNTSFEQLKNLLAPPFFVKPTHGGSSIGNTIVSNQFELKNALDVAFETSPKVLVEEFIEGREIECAVIGDNVSRLSEVITNKSYYDFESKYSDNTSTRFDCPAKINLSLEKSIQQIALKATKLLGSSQMSRVDFFVCNDIFYINEVNAIPGFTRMSHFAKMFEMSGLGFIELIDLLIENALCPLSVV